MLEIYPNQCRKCRHLEGLCRVMLFYHFVTEIFIIVVIDPIHYGTPARSIITKKGDGSQVKESTDSSTTIEDDDVKGRRNPLNYYYLYLLLATLLHPLTRTLSHNFSISHHHIIDISVIFSNGLSST